MQDGDKPGFGQHLAQAREAAGLSQEAAARKLRLSSDIVRALEQEDYEVLPAPAYVRGYIRAYAQSLGTDAEELVAQYNVHAGGDPQLSEFTPVEPYHSGRGPLLVWGSVAAIVILIVLAGFWAFDYVQSRPSLLDLSPAAPSLEEETAAEPPAAVGNDEEVDAFLSEQAAGWQDERSLPPEGPPVPGESADDSSRTPSPGDEPAQLQPAPTTDGSEQPVAATTGDRQSATESESEPSPETADAAPVVVPETPPEKREVVPAAPQGDDRLGIELNGTSWIEVYDANGYQLVYGLFGAEDRRVGVRGQAPFQVVLGDARQVGISVNDEAFKVTPYIRWNNTARLTVSPPVQ